MKHFFLLLALFLCALTPAFSQGVPHPATPRLMIDAAGTLISTTNPLPVDAEVNIGSITVDVFPVFSNAAGESATATVDVTNRVVISTEGGIAALVTAINPVADVATQTIAITGAAASVQITSGLTTRRWISISSLDPNQAIAVRINIGGAATTSIGRIIYTGVTYPIDESQDIWLFADVGVSVWVEEGGVK